MLPCFTSHSPSNLTHSPPTPPFSSTPINQTPLSLPTPLPSNTHQQVLTALEEAIARGDIPASAVTDDVLAGFFSTYGRRFYGVPAADRQIRLTRGAVRVAESMQGEGVEVVPFRAGEETWGVEWL